MKDREGASRHLDHLEDPTYDLLRRDFFGLGFVYLHFDAGYLANNPLAAAGFPGGDPSALANWATFGVAGCRGADAQAARLAAAAVTRAAVRKRLRCMGEASFGFSM